VLRDGGAGGMRRGQKVQLLAFLGVIIVCAVVIAVALI
jgi:hypothetical protein